MSDANGFAAGTLEEWKGRRRIPATLPSGMNVVLQAVTLDELAAIEGLPDDLLRVALVEMTPGGVPAEIARELAAKDGEELERAQRVSRAAVALRDRLVLAAVVEPEITADDVALLDGYDKAMIADIASRQTDEDASGRRVYGDQPIATFPEADPVG